jgi:hypothetical protein
MGDPKRTLTRTDLMKLLEPSVRKALIRWNVDRGIDAERRALRALVHIGVRRVLSIPGASPEMVAEQVAEALLKEIAAYKKHRAAGGSRSGFGPPLALA